MLQPGEKVSDLTLSYTPPKHPAEPILIGKIVVALPYEEEKHLKALFEVTNGSPIKHGNREYPAYDADKLIWRYLRWGPFKTAEDLGAYMREIRKDTNVYTYFDKASGHVIGCGSVYNNEPEDKKFELRFVVLSPIAQSAGIVFELWFLVCDYFFTHGYRRVHTWSNVTNTRSIFAHARSGFTFEGIIRSSIISKGQNMDIAIFRVLDYEWPEMRAELQRRIQASLKKIPKL